MALSCARGIAGLPNVLFFSVGSDGTDGPTDAAGGIVDGETVERIRKCGMDPYKMLENNDAYHALKSAGALVMTGATGTNVNDLTVLLIRP
ncbi:MAG: glycerate kinase, partial [Lachnospiraceae bacterium]|nr:glycerate kinase [Lachnospiraceae bacterium]